MNLITLIANGCKAFLDFLFPAIFELEKNELKSQYMPFNGNAAYSIKE
ncbi:hypothetical protein VR611_13265 [Aquirufa nivalisilvae]|jgi:hypothetical protein